MIPIETQRSTVLFPDQFGMLANTACIARHLQQLSPLTASEVAPALGYALACLEEEYSIRWGEVEDTSDWETVCFEIAEVLRRDRTVVDVLRYFPAREAVERAFGVVRSVLGDAGHQP